MGTKSLEKSRFNIVSYILDILMIGSGVFYQIRKFCLVSLAILLIDVPPAISQIIERGVLHFGLEDGLQSNQVNTIIQDNKGFIWIGTEGGGLQRFDGHSFVDFAPIPGDSTSLASGYVHDLLEGQDGSIWIGTRAHGVEQFNLRTERFTHYAQAAPSITGPDVISAIAEHEGTLWIASRGGGLQALDVETGHIETFGMHSTLRLPNDHLYDMIVDRTGNIWIASNNGLGQLSVKTSRFEWYPVAPPHTGPAGDLVTCIRQDTKGRFWIGAGGILHQFDPVTGNSTVIHSLHDRKGTVIRSILVDNSGFIWVGSQNGLDVFEAVNGKPVPLPDAMKPLATASTQALFEDRQGGLWIGTSQGLYRYDRDEPVFPRYEFSVEYFRGKAPIYDLFQAHDGILWAAAWRTGLLRYDLDSGAVDAFELDAATSRTAATVVFEDSEKRLWVGTWRDGLYQFDRKLGRFEKVWPLEEETDWSVRSIIEHDNWIWAGMGNGNGLLGYNMDADTFAVFNRTSSSTGRLSSSFVRSVTVGPGKKIWLGTGEGVYTYDPYADSFARVFPTSNGVGILDESISALHKDEADMLWLGTEAGGIYQFDPKTEALISISVQNSTLPSNSIASITSDKEGHIWAGTRRGLIRIEKDRHNIHVFTKRHGLQDLIFTWAAHRAEDGRLFFGGGNGFNAFYPQDVIRTEDPPPVAFTRLMVFHEPVKPGLDQPIQTAISSAKEIQLRHNQNTIALTFAGLSFSRLGQNVYSYRMEGLDPDWSVPSIENTATYTNLDPGVYTFRVRAANPDLVWNEEGTSINVIVAPPYWETWWFRLLIALALLGISTLIYRYRVAQLLAMDRMRLRIAGDLHDDIGSKLSGIALMSEMVEDTPELPATYKSNINRIGQTARSMIEDLRDIVWFIDPEHDQPGKMAEKFHIVARQLLADCNYRLDLPETLQMDKTDMEFRRHIFLIYKEALTNIVRHAQAHSVTIRVTETQGQCELSIEDDGQGFDVAGKHTGNGLKNMRRRAKFIRGALSITLRREGGTRVELRAPLP